MDEDLKERLYTLPLSYVLEQLEKADEQLIISQALLEHFFDSGEEQHKLLIPIVVDILWSNFGIVKILKPYLEDPVFFDNPDTGEQEYMVLEAAILNLQTLILARYSCNKELNCLSFSTGLH